MAGSCHRPTSINLNVPLPDFAMSLDQTPSMKLDPIRTAQLISNLQSLRSRIAAANSGNRPVRLLLFGLSF